MAKIKKLLPLSLPALFLDGVIDEMRSIAESPTEIRGCESGIEQLDDVTRGFRPGQLVVIAARPGIGKTAFAAASRKTDGCSSEEAGSDLRTGNDEKRSP